MWPGLDAASLRTLAAAVKFVTSRSRNSTVLWYPEYGCAVMGVPELQQELENSDLSLLLVGLDDWKFVMHR